MSHQKRAEDHGVSTRHPTGWAVLTVLAVATVGLVTIGMAQDANGTPGPTAGQAVARLTSVVASTSTAPKVPALPHPTTTTTAPPPTTTTIHVPVKHPTTPTVAPAPTVTVPTKPSAPVTVPTTPIVRVTVTTTPVTVPTTPVVPAPVPTTTTTAAPTATRSTSPTPSTSTTTTTTTAPPLSSIAADCSVDVSAQLTAYLAALPSGSVFTSPAGACYQVDEGITISHPLTINGGTWKDMTDTGTGPNQGYRPIIALREADNSALENLTVEGVNTTRGFKGGRVGEAGVKVYSSSHVTITNVTATDTFGDGLEMVADSGRNWKLGGPVKTPDSDIRVDGFTSMLSGRCGMTPAEVVDSTFDHIYLYQSATRSIDFESDIAGQGAGSDHFNNVVASHGINMVETLKGPITFDHTAMTGRFFLTESQGQAVTYENGSFLCERRAPGSCVEVKVGALTVTNTTLSYLAGHQPVTEVGYQADPGAQVNQN